MSLYSQALQKPMYDYTKIIRKVSEEVNLPVKYSTLMRAAIQTKAHLCIPYVSMVSPEKPRKKSSP